MEPTGGADRQAEVAYLLRLGDRTFFAERVEVETDGRRLIWDGRSGGVAEPGEINEVAFEVEQGRLRRPPSADDVDGQVRRAAKRPPS